MLHMSSGNLEISRNQFHFSWSLINLTIHIRLQLYLSAPCYTVKNEWQWKNTLWSCYSGWSRYWRVTPRSIALLLDGDVPRILPVVSLEPPEKWKLRNCRWTLHTTLRSWIFPRSFVKKLTTCWFNVTFSYPSWRSLSLWKGHLTIPKRSLWITW